VVITTIFAVISNVVLAEDKLQSDNDSFSGDVLRLKTNVYGFVAVNKGEGSTSCAPLGSRLSVKEQDKDGNLFGYFKSVPTQEEAEATLFKGQFTPDKAAFESCKPIVLKSEMYTISRDQLDRYAYSRRGVTFGGLVVPFKFYLGSDNKVITSSTLAPYIGYRGFSPFGLTLSPIISAGLGLVPVPSLNMSQTDTKTAFSTAAGFLFTSSKSKAFNAGLIVGKDFLSKADRATEPTVGKVWLSFYVGYAL
jgi:hypothetical protein